MATPAAHSFPIAVAFAALAAVIGSPGLPLPSSAGDEAAARRSPRLVILYVTCSLNRRFLAPYNDAVDFTLQLAKFASHRQDGSQGTRFAAKSHVIDFGTF